MKNILLIAVSCAFILVPRICLAVPYDQYISSGKDNFWSIARLSGVSATDLQNINPLVDPSNMWRGLMINLPAGHKPMAGLIPASEVSRTFYTVKSNDTFWTISKMFGINHSADPNQIFPGQVLTVPTAPPSISPSADWQTRADYIIATAKDQFDTPYVWGGTTPWVGMDCSGFTQYVFGKAGITIPRTSNWQFQYGAPVAKDQLRKGDLVFFKEHGSTVITHVGIYMGNDQMINADTGPKNGVQVEFIFGDDYYKACYAGAKRFF